MGLRHGWQEKSSTLRNRCLSLTNASPLGMTLSVPSVNNKQPVAGCIARRTVTSRCGHASEDCPCATSGMAPMRGAVRAAGGLSPGGREWAVRPEAAMPVRTCSSGQPEKAGRRTCASRAVFKRGTQPPLSTRRCTIGRKHKVAVNNS